MTGNGHYVQVPIMCSAGSRPGLPPQDTGTWRDRDFP